MPTAASNGPYCLSISGIAAIKSVIMPLLPGDLPCAGASKLTVDIQI
jgi:hypothetical protein